MIGRTTLLRTPDYTYKGLFRGGLILSGQILAIWVDFVRIFEVASEILADLSGSVK
jgi:hypothetical protein